MKKSNKRTLQKWQQLWGGVKSKPLGVEIPINTDFEIHFGLLDLRDEKFQVCF